jgi:hypothetical protein
MGLKGDMLAIMEDMKSNATAELRKIPKEAFRRCCQQLHYRWNKFERSLESNFEGD